MIETNEKIRILLKRKNLTVTELSEKIGTTRQNLTNKLARNNFNENDLKLIASALNCTINITFQDVDSGEVL